MRLKPRKKILYKIRKADAVIEGIIDVISNGEKQLKNDNKTLLIEIGEKGTERVKRIQAAREYNGEE